MMTLDEIYSLWVVQKARQVKKSTLATYRLNYVRNIQPSFGRMDVSSLTKKVIQPVLFQWMEEGKSAKFCHDLLILIRMIMRFAAEEMEMDIPDTRWRVIFPTVAKKEHAKVERYTQDEYRRIVDYAMNNPSPRNLGILLTICTGMRIGEVCALQWKDVDLSSKTIHINRTLERIYNADLKSTEVIFNTPKSESSRRCIPIMKNIFPIVKRFAAVCKPEYYVCTCSENHTEPRTLRNYYKRFIEEKVGIGRAIKFHGLRHTFATVLIENKVDVKTTSVLLGHADISTTMNVYVHPSEETKRAAMNAGLRKFFK